MNLYEILGVNKDVTPEELKVIYRSLCQKHHPDKNNGDHEIFVSIKNAYEILSNVEKRKHYDETGAYDQSTATENDKQQQRILVFLSGLVEQIINNDSVDVEKLNVLNLIQETIKNNIIGNNSAIVINQKKIDKRNKTIKRIKKKKDDINNFLSAMLISSNEQNTKAIERLKEGIADFTVMLTMVSDENYQYEIDTQPQLSQATMGLIDVINNVMNGTTK